MKQQNEVENLLALIFQDGRTTVKDGQLFVPSDLANQFGDQIRKFKPEIMKALGFCPVCSKKLSTKKVARIDSKTWKRVGEGSVTSCSNRDHYEKWEL